MRSFAFLGLALGLAACTPTTRLTRLDPTVRAPKLAQEVRVYREAPARLHSVIGVWRAEEDTPFGSQAHLEKRVLAEAAALGADAVILSTKVCSGCGAWLVDPSGAVTVLSDRTKVHADFIVWR